MPSFQEMITKIDEKLFNLNLNNFVVISICVFDLIAFIYDFIINSNFSGFTNFDRFVFYGLFFCLFFDSLLWGEKEFLGLQIIKSFILVINGKFSMNLLMAFFFLLLAVYYFDARFLQNTKNKALFLLKNLCIEFLFLCFISKNPLPFTLILIENLLICLPLIFCRIVFLSKLLILYPKNQFDLLLQDINEIPITAVSWILPFIICYVFYVKRPAFLIVCGILFFFVLFVEMVNYYKHYWRLNFRHYLWAGVKFGIIALLVLSGVKSGRIKF